LFSRLRAEISKLLLSQSGAAALFRAQAKAMKFTHRAVATMGGALRRHGNNNWSFYNY
jgi:hypothetical protein